MNICKSMWLICLTLVWIGKFTTPMAYASIDVTPENMRGWVINAQEPFVAPSLFAQGPGTPPAGFGSLNIGPIGSSAANKFIIFPPVSDIDSADLDSFSFDFYLASTSPVSVSTSQFYINVYIDSPVNGIGVFDTTFYDCRYDLVADGALGLDVWNTLGFASSSSTWTVINDQSGVPDTCKNTLDQLDANSRIMFIAINAGDTSADDAGLIGAIDNAQIELNSVVTEYDFEPYMETCQAIKATNGNIVVICL